MQTEKINNQTKADIQLDVLYRHYMESRGPDGEEVNRRYQKLYQLLEEYPRQKQNSIECAVNELCAAVERIAFLDGMHSGAQLILELLE